MPIVIDEVVAQVEPEPTPRRDPPATPPTRDSHVHLVRSQVAVIAHRASRLHAD
jgi:hypothetical protein